MSKSKYIAAPQDGQEILRILESSAAKGNIELLYTRRPDAYESYMKESGESRIFVSKDDERTIGTCAELIREVYIGGEICNTAYICGLKKDARYGGSVGFGAGFIRELWREDIDFYYCSVVSDNKDAQKMFEKSRRIISMNPITEYTTYILSTNVKIKSQTHDLDFRQATENDLKKLIDFLNKQGRKNDLFPVITSLKQFYGLTYKDFYILSKDNRIVATAALWNQTEYKQYVVKQYRGIMKSARMANPILSLLGYIKLPRENTTLDFPLLSFFISEDGNQEYYRIFLSEIKREIGKKYKMFVIGMPRNHFASSIFNKLPSIHFDTKLYEITFPWSKQNCKKINVENLTPECALL